MSKTKFKAEKHQPATPYWSERKAAINEGLDKYATTEREHLLFQALVDTGGDYDAMAQQLGLASVPSVRRALWRLRKKAAAAGWAPNQDVTRPTMAGFGTKRVSSYAKRDPNTGEMVTTAQWMIQERSKEDLAEAMRIACETLAEPLKGLAIPVRPWKVAQPRDEDLMVAYYIGDHHMGMYAWAEETGADYDCEIAERILVDAFDTMTAAAPSAIKGLVVSMGDYFHADNNKAVTPGSGHSLDTDSRHTRVIQTGVRVLKRAVEYALRKHQEVELIIIKGNHDPESTPWLAIAMSIMYEKEPRVTVRTDPRMYKYVRWGTNLIGLTHGHGCKPNQLPSVMAYDQPVAWGETKHREFVHGHVHHEYATKGERGCTVRSVRCLAGSDNWHAESGYRSERGMEVAVYHKRQGRTLTFHGTIEYINGE